MAKNKFCIGEAVATEMQQIIQSDEHKRIFFNKKASDKCCSCSSCDKDCPCTKCSKECKSCNKNEEHVHDSNCIHDQKTNAINEMIQLLSKVSAVQDELGLVQSSFITMQALATMVSEIRKIAQEDTNDIRWNEVIQPIINDTDKRREFWETSQEFPEIMALLRQRIEESHKGVESPHTDIFEEGVSADSASPIPSSDPDAIISPENVVDDDLTTWKPEAVYSPTELPPESMVLNRPLPFEGNVSGFNQLIEPEMEDEKRDVETVQPPKRAFQKLDILLNKQAQEYSDFEEEPDLNEEAELAALMNDIPQERGGQMRGHELEQMLMDEEDQDRELFDIPDEGYADDMMISDLDEEIEFGDFLAKPESTKSLVHDPLHEEEDEGYGFTSEFHPREFEDLIRLPGGEERKRVHLDSQDEADLENAHLSERLDMDPDQLSTEEVYPDDDFYSTIGDQAYEDFVDDPDESGSKRSRFWNDNEPTVNTKNLKMKPKDWWKDPKFPIGDFE